MPPTWGGKPSRLRPGLTAMGACGPYSHEPVTCCLPLCLLRQAPPVTATPRLAFTRRCVPHFTTYKDDAETQPEFQIQMPTCCGGMCIDVCAEGLCNCRIPFYVYAPRPPAPPHAAAHVRADPARQAPPRSVSSGSPAAALSPPSRTRARSHGRYPAGELQRGSELAGSTPEPNEKKGTGGMRYAQITKVWGGMASEMFTDADKFELEFPKGIDAVRRRHSSQTRQYSAL